MSWRPKTFKDDRCKDMHCTNCGRYLKRDSRLTDDKVKQKKCRCGTMNTIHPPRKAVIDGEPVILFRDAAYDKDPMQCTFTADYTG